MPRLAVLWLNYNGSHIRGVLKLSLSSIGMLASALKDAGVKVHAVVVDNHSTDGSEALVRKWVKELGGRYPITYVFIRTSRNWGYSGGMNIAYRFAGEADLVMLMNNDVVLNPQGAALIVSHALRAGRRIGGVQGIILRPSRAVDNAGCLVDELLATRSLREAIEYPTPVTYLSGALSVLRSDALRSSGMSKRLFTEAIPAYFDDVLVGIRLWKSGYYCVSLPVVAGFHLHSATFARYSSFKLMNAAASHTAMTRIVKSRYGGLVKVFAVKLLARMYYKFGRAKPHAIKPIITGVKLGRAVGNYLASREGRADIDMMPHVRLSPTEALKTTLLKLKLGDVFKSSAIAVGSATVDTMRCKRK